MLDQITPLILTHNEEDNIARTLDKLSWAREIVVLDSFSDDSTLVIVSHYPQVRVVQRRFDSFASQCNFGLAETGISTEWILSLDADYVLTDELIEELRGLKPASEVRGYRAHFIYCVRGKRLRSGVYTPTTVLFRRSGSHYHDDGHAHRVVTDGQVEKLRSAVLHDDRKPLMRWLQTQMRYGKQEAQMLIVSDPAKLSLSAKIRRLRIVAPLAMLFYCLIWRHGVLDGKAGFHYAFQRVIAELSVSLFLLDHDLGITTPEKISVSETELSKRSS